MRNSNRLTQGAPLLAIAPGSQMAHYDFAARRLYLDAPLYEAARITLNQTQANYVHNVLRLGEGAKILVFNGRDGEWEAQVAAASRKHVLLEAQRMMRPQEPPGDLYYLFAPLKHARLDYMVEKAVEMGASLLRPVITCRTQASRVNSERMRANAIEAAEQCGILSIPEIAPPARLDALLSAWDQERLLVFCDEDAPLAEPCAVLRARAGAARPRALAVLVGPEGGFDPKERRALLGLPRVVRLPLGPRILRADTAAVAALALVQAAFGDWRG
jgi:16S rRNA (uracil1498-N3)-methyltransferase